MDALERLLAMMLLVLVPAVGRAETGPKTGTEGSEVMAPSVVPNADLRLSGIVSVGGEPRLAVIELAGRGGRMMRVGDTLQGGAQVVAIGPDWVRLERQGEQRTLRLTSLPAGAVPAATPQPSVAAGGAPAPLNRPQVLNQVPDVLRAEGELREILAGVAAERNNSADALGAAIGAYLGLPAGTEIAVTDMGFGAFASAAAAKQALEEKGMIRVRIGAGAGGGEERMLYLQVPPAEKAQGAVE